VSSYLRSKRWSNVDLEALVVEPIDAVFVNPVAIALPEDGLQVRERRPEPGE
jgi:hypothetical protein